MALNNENNNKNCKCTSPEYEIVLNEQGPQGRQGKKGEAGFTPIISVKDNTDSNYTLNILTQDGQITTPNLKANLPAGGATGQVLTKNSANQDDCSWQNLPNATTEVEGIARLATEADFETTEDSSVSNTTIVTPALFNTEFEKKSTNFVTIDTVQSIDASKTFRNELLVYNNLTIPYNSSSQNGKIVTNATINDDRIPIIEPYDNRGSFKIGAAKEGIDADVQNGFDINNDTIGGLQGVTYYEVGQKGKLVASFNIDKYVKAGDNVTIDKGSDGSLTINSTGGGSGDATLAGDNSFTGNNIFNGISTFSGYTWVDFLTVGTSLTNQQDKKFLAQGSITSGSDNLIITETDTGIKISSTGGGITEIPQANTTALGGVKANPKTDEDTQAVNIDPATGLLYTKAGGTIEYIDGGNAQTNEPAVLKVSNIDLGVYPTNNIYSTNENITIK